MAMKTSTSSNQSEADSSPESIDTDDSIEPGSDHDCAGECDAADGYLSVDLDPEEEDFRKDAMEFLHRFETHENPDQYWVQLPAVHPSIHRLGPQATLSRMREHAQILTKSLLSGQAAVTCATPLWACSHHSLTVLCQAMSMSGTMPAFFLNAMLTSVSNKKKKDIGVKVAGFISHAKYWVADTAEQGSGKSPTIDPITKASHDVQAEEPALAPEKAHSGIIFRKERLTLYERIAFAHPEVIFSWRSWSTLSSMACEYDVESNYANKFAAVP